MTTFVKGRIPELTFVVPRGTNNPHVRAVLVVFTTREGSARMCIDGKTAALARKLKTDILDKIDNIDQAREMIVENIRTADSQIARMAELYYEHQAQFGIERKLDQVRRHPNTKKSALRGAIVLVLQEFIDEAEKALDTAALDVHDAEVGSLLVVA